MSIVKSKEKYEFAEREILNFLIVPDEIYPIRNVEGLPVDKKLVLVNLCENSFKSDMNKAYFTAIFKHIRRHGIIPSADEIYTSLKIDNVAIEGIDINREYVKKFFSLNVQQYSNNQSFTIINTFSQKQALEKMLSKMATYIHTTDVHSDNISDVINQVREFTSSLTLSIVKGKQSLDLENPGDHLQPPRVSSSTGDAWLDSVLGGGWEPKTVVVFVGQTKIGKSLTMAHFASRTYLVGGVVGVATLELSGKKYIKRIGATTYDIHYDKYCRYIDNPNSIGNEAEVDAYKKEIALAIEAKKAMCKGKTGKMEIMDFPIGETTYIDIENHYLEYEKIHGVKMTVIFVDYVNLMKGLEETDMMYTVVKKITEGLRNVAKRNDWCIVTPTQSKPKYENCEVLPADAPIESSGLAHTVDALIGLTVVLDDDKKVIEDKLRMSAILVRDGAKVQPQIYNKVWDYYRLEEENKHVMNVSSGHFNVSRPMQVSYNNLLPIDIQPQAINEIFPNKDFDNVVNADEERMEAENYYKSQQASFLQNIPF